EMLYSGQPTAWKVIVDPEQALLPPLSTPTFFQFQEEERYRIARAVLEGPGQILANTLMELEHALVLLDGDPAAVRQGLTSLRDEVRQGLDALKAFAAELQPPLLEELGLAACLSQYAVEFGARNRIEIECEGLEAVRDRLPATIETAIFRIVQEALANVAAHSKATSARVRVKRAAAQFVIEVQDNGRGFSTKAPAPKRRQLGMISMQDRAQLVGGHLQVFSEPGKGLRVVVTVPYHGQATDQVDGGTNENKRENQSGREGTGTRKRAAAAAAVQTGK
ncbi:MAG: sensor histidine kinase, partial [Rudaea sp.]